MAVYFDHKLEGPGSGTYSHIAWHKIHKMLAVGSYSDMSGGTVNLYINEGEMVQDCKGLTRMCAPAVMQWHPTKKILAIGWETGEIQIWNEHDHELYEIVHLHKSDIKSVNWTSNGTRILTGDSSGLVALWKTDSRGRPHQNALCQHNINEPLTTTVLRPPLPVDPQHDIVSLARAAVSGDESALDQFNWKKGKNARITTSLLGPQEAVCFFIGGKNGGVYYLNESMKLVQVFVADGPVRNLLYYEAKNILVTVTTTMMLSQHLVNQEGDTREMLKVKMSGKSQNPCIVWAGNGILGTATGESVVRMWDLEKEENFVLNLEGQPGYEVNEFITCIAFCPNKGVLAGGTGAGHVAMWQFSSIVTQSNKVEPEDRWKLQPPSTVEGAVSSLAWGSTKNLLAVNTIDDVYVLNEQIMSASYRDQVAVVQTSPTQLSVDLFSSSRHHDVKSDLQIKNIDNTKESIAVLDGQRAIVYEITPDGSTVRVAGTFGTETLLLCLYEQNVYTLDPGKVQVRTFQGTVKQVINFQESEGDPVSIDICGQYLVIGSTSGCIKVFDLSRREAKQHGSTKQLADVIPDFGALVTAKCNCNGNRVSIALARPNGSPDPKLYFWDVELDTVQYFNFETGRGEQDEYMAMSNEMEQDASDLDKGKNQAAKDIAGRFPVSHQWDSKEPKLLVCEAKILPVEQSQKSSSPGSPSKSLNRRSIEEQVEMMVVPLFVTPENGVLIQDSFPMAQQNNRLIGADVPYYYFMKKSEEAKEELKENDGSMLQPASTGFQRIVNRRTMRDFVGLENADKNAIDAMMNFSYFLTIGNMDEAFKAIKLIKSESVWENMAKMCVKSRRLDVASVCLGNMGHARGAKAMREAVKEPELDARVACLAIQLGLRDDAERLLKNCKRFDLLNEFYQSSGQWGKAMETAEMFDRVHLRTTYYNYAKHLESKGDINGAIPNYEKSETFRFEVPRMLFDEPQALESYIANKKDSALMKWWAQYMESTGEMDTALLNYELSQDYLSLVRVYCYCGNMEKAAEICNETGDRAACYHLGRQFENNDMIKEAIHFFTRASAYGNAIRLCKEHGMEDQLMNLALLARPESMMEAARYYEFKPGHQDKAVMLYHKAGNFSKALDLAFTTKQFGALQMISEDLDEKTDPELLQRCADFFTENSQFDRAVDLLGAAKKYWDALKLCMAQHVPMTEELVEKLTPPKDGLSENESEERIKILEGIAEVCMQQRQYHLATKKYTQAGNKVKAMKALLKSGDTEKIVFFAGVSRQKEIYVMAANYLQSLDWRKDPDIMKNIIGFYTKGRALELLAGFYDACAMVEIDEYQNYDKALGALNEAYKCMAKAKVKNTSMQEEKLGELKNKMMLIKKFVTARRTYEEDSEEGIKQCQVLLEEQHLDDAVRIGDVFGFIIEHYAKREKWKAAYSCMEEMRSRIPKANPAYYINMRTIEAIHRALDIPMPKGAVNGVQMGGAGEEEDGEEVEEDVVDDFANDDSVC